MNQNSGQHLIEERMELDNNTNDSKHTDIDFEPMGGACMIIVLIVLIILEIFFCIVLPSFSGSLDLIFSLGIGFGLGFVVVLPLLIITISGFKIISPNEAVVCVLFGTYKGTCKKNGFYWINPFMNRNIVTLKLVNYDLNAIKVNDKSGNPIMIGGIVIYKVEDCAKALFDVQYYQQFVQLQIEIAIRKVAYTFNYDLSDEDEICLKGGHIEVNQYLKNQLSESVKIAGIKIHSTEITHLCYASEIASVMLRRQQAEAVVSARKKIIEGAVSITGMALDSLKSNNIADLNESDRAKLISNLLVVLCSESQVNPIVNAGEK